MKPQYAKIDVQPVIVKKISENSISIEYMEPPETVMYSKGVNYSIKNNQMRVIIDRCHIGSTCTPMAEKTTSPENRWKAKVIIPFHGEDIIMVYSDTEERIY